MENKENFYNVTEDLNNLVYVVRDCNLPDKIAQKYNVGMIIREKGFCDATYIIGGMSTSHRFTILSNQFFDMSSFDEDNKGLCVTNKDARFKVLDKFTINDKTQITLLELPRNGKWKNFKDMTYIIEKRLAQDAREKFAILSKAEPLPQQNTKAMLARFDSPLGMNDDGEMFPLE